jgi:hypothetical protein
LFSLLQVWTWELATKGQTLNPKPIPFDEPLLVTYPQKHGVIEWNDVHSYYVNMGNLDPFLFSLGVYLGRWVLKTMKL